MLCEKCGKKEATFYYRENIGGTEKSYKLCADCAAELQKSGEISTVSHGDLFGEPFASPLTQMQKLLGGDDLFGSLLGLPQKERTAERGKTCPLCGSSFGDIARSGKAGCPRCYTVFEEELLPSLRRIHGRTAHTGQAPARFREENEKKQKITALEAELKEAIRQENYEHAAELRDSLRALRQDGT